MKKNHKEKEIVIYQNTSGAIELRGDLKNETIWANLDQIAHVFGRDKSVISRHIKNIFKDDELSRNSVVAFFATTASDGKVYNVEYFNLDLILSVGYRVNSKQATRFRQWATKILREHITKGYTINPAKIKKNYTEFLSAVDKVKALLPANIKPDTDSILELIKSFADTWLSLNSYDREIFSHGKVTKKKISLATDELSSAISEFKTALLKKSEATAIFAQERSSGSVEGIIGNVMQSFAGKDLYPSIEEKAAHLLYFMVKNHPFVDGNKRSGAFSFIWFLRRAGLLNTARLTPPALTALTLLIAESNPKDKDKMVGLVTMLLRK